MIVGIICTWQWINCLYFIPKYVLAETFSNSSWEVLKSWVGSGFRTLGGAVPLQLGYEWPTIDPSASPCWVLRLSSGILHGLFTLEVRTSGCIYHFSFYLFVFLSSCEFSWFCQEVPLRPPWCVSHVLFWPLLVYQVVASQSLNSLLLGNTLLDHSDHSW